MSATGLSDNDKNDLVALSGLCPGTNGMVVYMARALYLQVTGKVFNAPYPCNERAGGRPASSTPQTIAAAKLWDVEIYPNPTSHQLNITCKTENEILAITITDLTGRVMLETHVKTNGFIANLDLELPNGAFFITIENTNNDLVTKKLLIAK